MSLKLNLKAGILLNMVMPRISLNEEVKTILSDYGIPLHTATIRQRVSYTRSPVTGSVFSSEDERAKDEVINLSTEILERVNN